MRSRRQSEGLQSNSNSIRNLPAVGANAIIFPNAAYMPTLESSIATGQDQTASPLESTRNFYGNQRMQLGSYVGGSQRDKHKSAYSDKSLV